MNKRMLSCRVLTVCFFGVSLVSAKENIQAASLIPCCQSQILDGLIKKLPTAPSEKALSEIFDGQRGRNGDTGVVYFKDYYTSAVAARQSTQAIINPREHKNIPVPVPVLV